MIEICQAELEDAKELLAIYAPYVEETAITFEYEVPSLDDFRERMKHIMRFYPYLVAKENSVILGYAYASAFHERAAYQWSAEVSIYLAKAARGKGLGRKLYETLEAYLKQMGVLNLNACIASTSKEDAHLTSASQKFHEAFGYHMVGRFHKTGYKFERWYDMIWMEKALGEHTTPPKALRSFQEILGEER